MQNNVASDQNSSSWFHSLLYSCVLEKLHVTSAQSATQNTLYTTWRNK